MIVTNIAILGVWSLLPQAILASLAPSLLSSRSRGSFATQTTNISVLGDFILLDSGVRLYGSDSEGHHKGGGGGHDGGKNGTHPHTGRNVATTHPRDASGWCGASTIENVGSDNSPFIADCVVIRDQVYQLAADNNAYFGRSECISATDPAADGEYTCYFPVVAYESCMFGASTIDSGVNVAVRIGWQDVGDLINSSIKLFGDNPSLGKVGTWGEMDCPEEINATSIFGTGWGLYRAP